MPYFYMRKKVKKPTVIARTKGEKPLQPPKLKVKKEPNKGADKGTPNKDIKIVDSKTTPLGAGSHQLRALSRERGIVKPKTRKKNTSMAHYVKMRNRQNTMGI